MEKKNPGLMSWKSAAVLFTIVWVMCCLVVIKSSYSTAAWDEDSLLEVVGGTAEKLGAEYEGQKADAGNAFYKVTLDIENTGCQQRVMATYYLTIETEESDLPELRDARFPADADRELCSDCSIVVPAGRCSAYPVILEAGENDAQITATIYSSDHYDEKEIVTIPLK